MVLRYQKKLNEKYLIFKSNCEMSYEEDVKKMV